MKFRLIVVAIATLWFGIEQTTAQSTHRQQQKGDLEISKSMEIMLSVFRDANLFYVDTLNAATLVRNAMNGMLSELDPYTEYIASESLDDFEFVTTGKYAGIGALIRQRGEWVEIAEPYRGTPSDRVGLKAGDRLLSIDGVDLHKLGSAKVSSMLKGDRETAFTLTYRPIADTTKSVDVEIIREIISVPGVPYSGMVSDSVGYILLNSFTEGSAKEVRSAFEKLRSGGVLSGLILDLRGNGGGSVGEAIDIISMFVAHGVEVLNIRGKIREMNSSYSTRMAPVDIKIPLTILMNSSSASSSEIVAGALQDLDRAVIIGQRSFGKGLVQSTRPTPYNGLLKITTAKYYTPSGRCIQAVDYTHRREDGSVGHIPDSLINSFTTLNGRNVYNGGGIMPDVRLEPEYMSKFAVILSAYGFIDDFANLYVTQNRPSKESFFVDDELYAKFVKFMAHKTIQYESLSEKRLKELREAAVREKYSDRITAELDAIAHKIKEDKNVELQQFASEIKDLLEGSILTRLYYSSSAIERALKIDKTVEQAVELLGDSVRYHKILKEQHTDKN